MKFVRKTINAIITKYQRKVSDQVFSLQYIVEHFTWHSPLINTNICFIIFPSEVWIRFEPLNWPIQ